MKECDMEEDEVNLSALDEVVGEVVGEVVVGENEPENCVLGTEEPSLQSTALSALDEVVGVQAHSSPEQDCCTATEQAQLTL